MVQGHRGMGWGRVKEAQVVLVVLEGRVGSVALEVAENPDRRFCLELRDQMEFYTRLALPPLAHHVLPFSSAAHPHPDIFAPLNDRNHTSPPEDLVVLRPHGVVELVYGPVDGVYEVVVRLPHLVLVSREIVELRRSQHRRHGEPVWRLQPVPPGVVHRSLSPGPDSLHKNLGLDLYLLVQRQLRVAGDVYDL